MKRILAGLVLLLSVVGFLVSIAGGVGVWLVKQPVTDKATRTFARIETALDSADTNLEQVRVSLARAAERLDAARAEQRQQPPSNNTVRRMLARTVQQNLAPEIGNAHDKLHFVAEAAVVVNSVLEDVGNIPFLSTAGVDIERLSEAGSQLAGVGSTAWELSRLLGESNTVTDDADAQLSRIERTVAGLRGLLDEYRLRLAEVRQRTEELKAKVFAWIGPTVVVVSLVCFWIAVSQVSLLNHARAWWRSSTRGENVV